MIWYYLYMGLLVLALLVWILAAMRAPGPQAKTPASPEPDNRVSLHGDQE